MKKLLIAALALAAAACGGDDGEAEKTAAAPQQQTPSGVRVAWDRGEARLTAQQLDEMRRDTTWQEVVQLDPVPGGRPERPNPEKWEHINADTVNHSAQFVPVYGDVAGPSALRVQILLDRALFSPGIMDGRWGKNTAEALYWFQRQQGIPAHARADSVTFDRLRRAAGNPQELVVRHTLTAEDVKGPFQPIPEDIYEHAKLSCSCYESLTEKLTERFHATEDLLKQLNPDVDLNGLRAGQQVNVPNVRNPAGRISGQIAKLVVSGRGTYLHAVDGAGKILAHFPSTLGGKYSPSPTGSFKVNAVTQDPAWHYQPNILVGVPDNEPEAMIPAGPNVAVGTVWMDLSEPHYGIHGTAEPQTIGYASSNGCVRLTNWDVEFLSKSVRAGTPVEFRDIQGSRSGGSNPAVERSATDSAVPTGTARASGSRGQGTGTAAREASSGARGGAARESGRPETGRGRSGTGASGRPGTSGTGTRPTTTPARDTAEDHSHHDPPR
ncbi:MAG TPA: L,D-transpeptidase family protein [Longimicrobium sp.]|nr:L,D-transpeptidase family protein [Longimicrobium sp.]